MTPAVVEQAKKLQALVVYDLVNMDFVWRNIYAMGGTSPNAKFIAGQYGCQLEVRTGKFESLKGNNYTLRWLLSRGIDPETGECMTAVVVGEDRIQLVRARNEIYRTFGVTSGGDISVRVNSEKIR